MLQSIIEKGISTYNISGVIISHISNFALLGDFIKKDFNSSFACNAYYFIKVFIY